MGQTDGRTDGPARRVMQPIGRRIKSLTVLCVYASALCLNTGCLGVRPKKFNFKKPVQIHSENVLTGIYFSDSPCILHECFINSKQLRFMTS